MPIKHLPESEYLELNGLRHHVRRWLRDGAPKLFLLHGWMDCADSFQFLVDALPDAWDIIALDWRGFGRSAWNSGSYYFPDYLADLDALLEHYSPKSPALLVGHSMGGIIASLYAGIRADRVAKLVSLEGFGLPDTQSIEAPGRYARWLKEIRHAPGFGSMADMDQLVDKLIERSPRLTRERALLLAPGLAETTQHGLRYRADPRHKMVNPVLYRLEEAKACWRQIRCPVLWLIGGDTWSHPIARGIFDTLEERRACIAHLEEVTIPEGGHMMHWEQPAVCAAAISRFLHDAS